VVAVATDADREERLDYLVQKLSIPRDEARILLENLEAQNGE